jgi:hypothetical protein
LWDFDEISNKRLFQALLRSMAEVFCNCRADSASSGDAESLCSHYSASRPRCSHDNKVKLSVPCRKVVEAHGG